MAGNDKDLLIKVRADLQQAVRALEKISGRVGDTGRKSGQAARQVQGLGNSFKYLRNAAAAYLSLRTVQQAVKLADAYNVLQVRIRTATAATGNYNLVSKKLYQITQNNGIALADTVALFQRLARSGPQLQATTDEMLVLTNAVQQLGVIGGSTNQELKFGLQQFSQALSLGRFEAEEVRSILENIPELAVRIEKGLGLMPGTFKNAANEGRVLSKEVFVSLIKQALEIAKEFANIPLTVQRTGMSLTNSITQYLAKIDKAAGVTANLAAQLKSASESLDNAEITEFLEILKDIAIIAGSLAAGRLLGPLFRSVAVAALLAAQSIGNMNIQLAAAEVRSLAAAGAAKTFWRALALLGGPAGIILGAATALTFWATSSNEAAESTKQLSARIDALLGDMKAVKQGQLEQGIRDVEQAMDGLIQKIKDYQSAASAGGSPLSDYDRQVLQSLGAEYVGLKAKVGRLKDELNKLGEEKVVNKKKTKGLSKEEKDLAKKINDTIAALQLQAITFGMTATAATLYKLKLKGASEEQLKLARIALGTIDDERKFQEADERLTKAAEDQAVANHEREQAWADAAESVRQMIDPTRELNQELAQYLVLLNAGKITAEEYAAAQENVKKRLEDVKNGLDEASKFAQKAAENIQTAMGRELTNILEGNFDTIGSSFLRMINRMVAEAAAAKIAESLMGDFGKTGKMGGIVGSFMTNLGFAEGGRVSGPGTGTSDSIAARISNGEYIVKASAVKQYGVPFFDAINSRRFPASTGIERIHSPKVNFAEGGLAVGSSNQTRINVIQNISTPDVQSFKKSTGQISMDAARAIQRAMRRNG